jgi:hypothetical protein
MAGSQSRRRIFSRLESETHHETDHADHSHQTEEHYALTYLGAKTIVRLFADGLIGDLQMIEALPVRYVTRARDTAGARRRDGYPSPRWRCSARCSRTIDTERLVGGPANAQASRLRI